MSAHSFRSVFMVASCAGAALGCYLISLRVASERAALERVETQIVLAERDLRVLETEIGTRGRLAQLERWNVKVLALSAPSADQFLGGSFELARLTRPQRQVDFEAPVVLASAPAPAAGKPPIGGDEVAEPDASATSPGALLHDASLKIPARETAEGPTPAAAKPVTKVDPDEARASTKSSKKKTAENGLPEPAKSAPKNSVDKPELAPAKAVTKPVRIAKTDPLAPLPAKGRATPSKDSSAER